MKESVGYTVTLNIVIMFIIIIFAFISAILIYYKTYKVGNIIVNSIEKYEGYNSLSINEIKKRMSTIGYNVNSIKCESKKDGCNLAGGSNGSNGYCVYECNEEDYYYYKIKSKMIINIPIINELLSIPVFSNTNRLYDFQNNLDVIE